MEHLLTVHLCVDPTNCLSGPAHMEELVDVVIQRYVAGVQSKNIRTTSNCKLRQNPVIREAASSEKDKCFMQGFILQDVMFVA